MNLHQGRFAVGAFDVDARTGAMLDQAQRVAAIQGRAAAMASALPPTPQIRILPSNTWPRMRSQRRTIGGMDHREKLFEKSRLSVKRWCKL